MPLAPALAAGPRGRRAEPSSATEGRQAGCGGIAAISPLRCAVPALIACLLLGAAPAAQGALRPPGPKPQLLLFHGGSFLFDDPNFEPATVGAARAAGFVPHYVSYPLGDMPAAVLRARAEARRLRDRFGVDRVYAFGYSAGGTLAALLAGDGLVAGAVAKAPPTDLVGWQWPLAAYGPDYYAQIGLDEAARYRLSPLRRPAKNPLLVLQGRRDGVVPLAMSQAFADKFEQVRLWVVAGGHTTERRRPWLVDRSMRWLARTAGRQEKAAEGVGDERQAEGERRLSR